MTKKLDDTQLKKLDDDELKKITGAGQDPPERECDCLEWHGPGGGGGNDPEPVDFDKPGRQHIQE